MHVHGKYENWNTRYKWVGAVPYIGVFIVIYLTTWVIPMDTGKIFLQMIVWCLLMRMVTGDRWRNIIVAFCLSFYFIAAVSFLEMTVIQISCGTNSMMLEGKVFLTLPDYVLAAVIKTPIIVGLLQYRKYFRYTIRMKDMVIIGVVTFVFYLVCYGFATGFYDGNMEWYDMVSAMAAMLFCLSFLLLMLFYKNNVYLKEQNRLANQQIREAQMQYQYYLEKEKQEEKVLRIYHDMKNHLLLLKNGQVSAKTRQAAEKISLEISGYEDYVQSGNQFLDIILNDKAKKAREREIDFSVFVDFSEITFIELLDISTIFGNGIDNALEACEELPPEKRIVTVKGGRREKFVMILIENNCVEDGSVTKRRTLKEDMFLHGFGIPNIKRAVRKYGGECRIAAENGRCSLMVIIPFSFSSI